MGAVKLYTIYTILKKIIRIIRIIRLKIFKIVNNKSQIKYKIHKIWKYYIL
jgi:hypothetical protein